MVINTEGKLVAGQRWKPVQNVMTYAEHLFEPLLRTLWVLEAEVSPFCQKFESLADLKDECLIYQAKTIVFNGRRGTGTGDTEEDPENGVPDASPEEIVLRRTGENICRCHVEIG